MNSKIKLEHLTHTAVVYVRESTLGQVEHLRESQRGQYSLVDRATQLGLASVETIDDDLGRSESGLVERPGFRSSSRWCAGEALEASFALKHLGFPAMVAIGTI
jgi:hypothetical protein